MPGLTSAPTQHRMSPAESYERLEQFLSDNRQARQFTVDDDNHGMGLVCAMVNDTRRAAVVHLNRSQLQDYMQRRGYELTSRPDSTALECTLPQ